MSTQLVDNFSLSAKKFLDNRQSWTSLDELQANTNVLMPNGFLAYCKAENKWYIMSCTDENDPSTYTWTKYTIGNETGGNVVQVATLPVANAENKNCILQYIGKDDTDLGLVRGYWYKCTMLLINDEITYKWLPINVQHNNGIDVYKPNEEHKKDCYYLYNNYVYVCITDNKDSDFIEANYKKVGDELTLYDKQMIEEYIGLSQEELETINNLIEDDAIKVDKTHSSSKIYADIQQCLKDSKEYTLKEIAKKVGTNYKIVESEDKVTSTNCLYLVGNETNGYKIYAYVDKVPKKLSDSIITLEGYAKEEELTTHINNNVVHLTAEEQTIVGKLGDENGSLTYDTKTISTINDTQASDKETYSSNKINALIQENKTVEISADKVKMADNTTVEDTVSSLKEDLGDKVSKETVTNIVNNIDTINTNISNLNETKANRNEIANGLNAKGACLYTELPTEGNSNGDYYYCSDGNGTDGAGNYVWNGTAWFFGGLGNNFGAKNVKLTDGTNIEDSIINLNKNKLNYYNAKFYGLDESKTSEENTRILQNLINYVYNNGGGIIYIPNGDYHFCISDTTNYYSILLKPNVSIIGENKYKTKLIMDNGDTPYTFMWRNTGADTPLENAHFEKFSVIGTALTEWHVRAKAFFAQYVKHCVFKDLYLEGTPATALGIDFLDDVTIDHITCKDCGHLWTKGNTGSAGIGIGTGGFQDENFIITNNVCVGCGQYGIFVENQNTIFKNGNYPDAKGMIIANNIIRDGLNHGIGNRGVVGLNISNNLVYGNVGAGIFNEGGIDTNISNNNIWGNKDGIYLLGDDLCGICDTFNIVGNTIKNNSEYGIMLTNTNSTTPNESVSIFSNIIKNNTSNGLRIHGTLNNIIVKGNANYDGVGNDATITGVNDIEAKAVASV